MTTFAPGRRTQIVRALTASADPLDATAADIITLDDEGAVDLDDTPSLAIFVASRVTRLGPLFSGWSPRHWTQTFHDSQIMAYTPRHS